jgi:hypothetical protein
MCTESSGGGGCMHDHFSALCRTWVKDHVLWIALTKN